MSAPGAPKKTEFDQQVDEILNQPDGLQALRYGLSLKQAYAIGPTALKLILESPFGLKALEKRAINFDVLADEKSNSNNNTIIKASGLRSLLKSSEGLEILTHNLLTLEEIGYMVLESPGDLRALAAPGGLGILYNHRDTIKKFIAENQAKELRAFFFRERAKINPLADKVPTAVQEQKTHKETSAQTPKQESMFVQFVNTVLLSQGYINEPLKGLEVSEDWSISLENHSKLASTLQQDQSGKWGKSYYFFSVYQNSPDKPICIDMLGVDRCVHMMVEKELRQLTQNNARRDWDVSVKRGTGDLILKVKTSSFADETQRYAIFEYLDKLGFDVTGKGLVDVRKEHEFVLVNPRALVQHMYDYRTKLEESKKDLLGTGQYSKAKAMEGSLVAPKATEQKAKEPKPTDSQAQHVASTTPRKTTS